MKFKKEQCIAASVQECHKVNRQIGSESYPRSVVGGCTGLAFPPTIPDLLDQGADFLTRAFHATGALNADNRVSAITRTEEFFGGGMGRKLLLSVSYEKLEKDLQTELFVKFPRDFGDPLRDLFGPLMEPEVRFALLSRQPGFPVAVPKCYFADYDSSTTSGILITERILYGQGNIEPCHAKCLDYTLKNPLGHYRALTRSMAYLAGYHRAGRFGREIEKQFPFDPEQISDGARIPYTPPQLQEKLEKLQRFAAEVPQLFADDLGSPDFLQRFARDALLVLQCESAIRKFLNNSAGLIALCHWNMNLDNAWFWSDDEGQLQAGLLDWGSVGQMNVVQAFYGMTCAAETDFLNAHRRDLMQLFIDEFQRSTGAAIDIEAFGFQYKLAVAVLGIAWILDAPSLIEAEIPTVREVKDRFDPAIRDVFLARAQLQLLVVFLNEWRANDIGAALHRFAATASA